MGEKIKRFIAIFAIIAVFCAFTSCYSNKQSDAQTGTETRKTEQNESKTDEKFKGRLDLTKIHKDGYTAGEVIYAGGKTILIAANSPGGASDHSKNRLYAANLDTGNVWEKYIEVGDIVITDAQSSICDDGETAIVESIGKKKNILFVNPKDMTAKKIAVPGEDIWNVAVSPDKKKIAYTKYDGTYLCDISFSKIELILPRKAAVPKNELNDELPKVIGFTSDSTQIFYHNVGYESDLGYGFFNISTRTNRYLSLPDMKAAFFSDNKLFLSKVFEHTPVGYIDVSGTSGEIQKMNGLPKDSVIDINISPGSGLIGVLRQKGEKAQARIYDQQEKLLFETTIDNPHSESIRILENQGVAVLTTQEYAGGRAEVIVWRFQ